MKLFWLIVAVVLLAIAVLCYLGARAAEHASVMSARGYSSRAERAAARFMAAGVWAALGAVLSLAVALAVEGA